MSYIGPRGPTGPTGPRGPSGSTGITGTTGRLGTMGPTGFKGKSGVPGTTGPTGKTGPTGIAGTTVHHGNFTTTTGVQVITTIGPASYNIMTQHADTGTYGYDMTSKRLYVYNGSTWILVTQPIVPYYFYDNLNKKILYITPPPPTYVWKQIVGFIGDLFMDQSQKILYIYRNTQWIYYTTMVGATGPTGTVGDNGVTGPTGSVGRQGVTGPTGTRGMTGLNGCIGNDGTTGSTGSTGYTGASGCVGPTGWYGIGITGPTGPVRNTSWDNVVINWYDFTQGDPYPRVTGNRYISSTNFNRYIINYIYQYNGMYFDSIVPVQGMTIYHLTDQSEYVYISSQWISVDHQVSHNNLSNRGTYTHAQIDTLINKFQINTTNITLPTYGLSTISTVQPQMTISYNSGNNLTIGVDTLGNCSLTPSGGTVYLDSTSDLTINGGMGIVKNFNVGGYQTIQTSRPTTFNLYLQKSAIGLNPTQLVQTSNNTNMVFVAIAGGSIVLSNNLTIWGSVTTTAYTGLTSGMFNGVLLYVGGNASNIAYSSNLSTWINWVTSDTTSNQYMNRFGYVVCNGASIPVVISGSQNNTMALNRVYLSFDGVTSVLLYTGYYTINASFGQDALWIIRRLNTNYSIIKISQLTYTGTYTSVSYPTVTNVTSLATGYNWFNICTSDGTVYYSTDLTTTPVYNVSGTNWTGMASSNFGIMIVVGYVVSSNASAIAVSYDGLVWSNVTVTDYGQLLSVMWSTTMRFIIGATSGTILSTAVISNGLYINRQ